MPWSQATFPCVTQTRLIPHDDWHPLLITKCMNFLSPELAKSDLEWGFKSLVSFKFCLRVVLKCNGNCFEIDNKKTIWWWSRFKKPWSRKSWLQSLISPFAPKWSGLVLYLCSFLEGDENEAGLITSDRHHAKLYRLLQLKIMRKAEIWEELLHCWIKKERGVFEFYYYLPWLGLDPSGAGESWDSRAVITDHIRS